MARTMVEDDRCVKPLPGQLGRRSRRHEPRSPNTLKSAPRRRVTRAAAGVKPNLNPAVAFLTCGSARGPGRVMASGCFMRFVIAAAASVAVLLSAASAQAEKQLFIVANNPDGYGIDRCLAASESCGKAAANSYCHSREFAQALSYRKVDRDDITGAIPSTGSCDAAHCEDFVAIECQR